MRAQATVSDYETSGASKYASTHCTGSGIVGATDGDVRKTIDVTLRGDTAVSRDLTLPRLLLGLGLSIAGAGAVLRLRASRRH